MSRISLAALAIVLCTTSVSLAEQPAESMAYGGYGATFGAYTYPQPSGLRFSGADTIIHPQGLYGDYGGCSSCSAGLCLDWKLVTWYGSWDEPTPHGGGRCRGCAY